jgi:tetratricopeptide (TPR) repeat protein
VRTAPPLARGRSLRAALVLLGAPAAALLVLAPGCLPRGPAVVERVVGAERRRGPWIPPSGYEHFVRGELALEAGRLREAITEYELARSGVLDGYVIAREAEAAARLPDAALAERLIDEGLATDARSEALLVLRGRLARERGDLDAAERALRAATEAAPESAAPALALADLLVARGQHTEALALLDAFSARRPDDVPALRALVVRASLAGDARVASLAALRLVRASPVHRPEVLDAARAALDAGQSAVSAAVLRALPSSSDERELALRFRAALAVHDVAECERLAQREEDGTREGRLRAAERWIALGDGARAQELAESVLLEVPSARAQRLVAHGLHLQGEHGRAAELLAAIGPGTSEEGARAALLRDVIAAAGLPALAAEVEGSSR